MSERPAPTGINAGYPYYCDKCWRMGTEDDGISGPGTECPDEECDGTIQWNISEEER